MAKNFANTGVLMAFTGKRDRIRLFVWILGISLFVISLAVLMPELYPEQADKMVLAETMKNPAISFMIGYSAGLENYTDGAIMGHFMIVFSAIFAAIMSILLINRYTSEDEEEGRTEMINSLPVGSLSNLSSSFFILCISNIMIALIIGLGMYSLRIETMDFEGSIFFGACIGATGIFYAAITGLFAQLGSNTRATLGFSFGFLIFDYLIRGIGDTGTEALSYITPLGLVVRTEVYVNNHWWPLLIILGLSLVIFIFSLYLNSTRDLGSGLFPTRPGKSSASRFLASPLGLALRLQRTTIIVWLVSMFVIGMAYGSLLDELEGFLQNSELIQQMIPDAPGMSLTERFVTMLITIISVLGTIPAVMFVLKIASEERKMRTEILLTTPASRNSWLLSYTLIGFIAVLVIQFVSIFGLWSAAVLVMKDGMSLRVLLQAALVNMPAMWIFTGLAVFLTGWLPKLTSLTWFYLAYSFFLEYIGAILKVPDWVLNTSPFAHIPKLADDDIEASVLIVMCLISLLLVVAGFIGYNRRDIEG